MMTTRSRLISLVVGAPFLFYALLFSSSVASSSKVQTGMDPSDLLPDGEGKVYVQTFCTNCHGLDFVVDQRKSREDWEATVFEMLDRLSPGMESEAEIISNYLSQHLSVEGGQAEETPIPATSPSEKAFSIGIFHQVLFSFKAGISDEQKKAVLDSGITALGGIPQVLSLLVGKVAQENSEFQYGLVVGVRNKEDLEKYRNHPEHRRWLEETYRPMILKSSVRDIVALQ